ncbi:MAG: HAD family hydrolase [Dehalococcoidia bacterium]
MRLRAVFFDIGDTLWHEAYPEMGGARGRLGRSGASAWAEQYGFHTLDPDRVASAAWNALTAARRAARRSDLREPDAAVVAQQAIRSLGAEIGLEPAAALMDAIYVSGAASGKALYEDAVPVIDEIRRRGFLVGMITNRAFGGARFRADLRTLGLDFAWDAEVVSAEAGFMKPHPAIFRRALAEAKVAAAESLMVGDSLADDIAGAEAVGMQTAWRRTPAEASDEVASAGVVPGFTFDVLTELLEHPGLRPGGA